jgi:L-lysine 6-transaminase
MFFKEGLEKLSSDYPFLTAVRGRGLMIAFDLPDKAARESFYQGLYEIGLLAIRSGERAIRFRPVLNVTEQDLSTGLDMLREQCRRGISGPDISGGLDSARVADKPPLPATTGT